MLLLFGATACASAPTPRTATTAPAIRESDLRSRLSIFADDSMLGRSALNAGHDRATTYLAAELRRMGLTPAGDDGSYFQTFAVRTRKLDAASVLNVGDAAFRPVTDFKVFSFGRGQPRPIDGASVIFGGIVGDTATQISREHAAGRVVLLGVPTDMTMYRAYSNVTYGAKSRFGDAAAVVIASLDYLSPGQRATNSSVALADAAEPPANDHPISILVTRRVANLMLGHDVDHAAPGSLGRTVMGRLVMDETDHPTRNVIAVIPGTDHRLKQEYVALGAHSDHLGIALQPTGTDSIYNGADDDGSGSVALLEIAEHFASETDRPRRSLLFVWHAAEEIGLLGSGWFTNRPTVPLDSIVAQLNLDMIGRGSANDLPAGGPGYLEVIGASRRSSALEQMVESVNRASSAPLTLDTADPDGLFCRSDHWNYARAGVPIAFFTTGLHKDYHQVTDEAQNIDYPKLERVTRFVAGVARALADTAAWFEPPGGRSVSTPSCAGR